nr:DUF6275 family protein [uncultured Mitsuokella sp.]
MQEKAKQIVVDYFNARVDKTDKQKISVDDVYVVWFCKTLQNWKRFSARRCRTACTMS